MIHAILEVFRYEAKRSFAAGRLMVWGIIALAPLLLMGMVLYLLRRGGLEPPIGALALISFFLIPQIATMLGQLLWATPILQSELEAQTWIYVTLRPSGRTALLVGKFLVAVVWSGTAATISCFGTGILIGTVDGWRLVLVLLPLAWGASLCYAALYALIGVIVLKRTAVLAMVYSLVMEAGVAFLPSSNINQFSISYHLRSLLALWVQIEDLTLRDRIAFGTESAMQHAVVLGGIACITLFIAIVALRFREIPLSTEY